MDTVGIRELKAHLSRHLKRVRSGTTLPIESPTAQKFIAGAPGVPPR
jgi:hypothetical protein